MSISVLGKSNVKPRYQYWFRAMIITHLRLVRLGKSKYRCENTVPYGDRTHALHLLRSLSFLLRHRDCWNNVFCAVLIRLKEANFKRESEQIILHGRIAFTIAQYWLTLGVRYGHVYIKINSHFKLSMKRKRLKKCFCFLMFRKAYSSDNISSFSISRWSGPYPHVSWGVFLTFVTSYNWQVWGPDGNRLWLYRPRQKCSDQAVSDQSDLLAEYRVFENPLALEVHSKSSSDQTTVRSN